MKKIGIVGGIAWPSTAEYYCEIYRLSEQSPRCRNPGTSPEMPEMVIESLDHNKAVAYIGTEGDEASWSQFDEYHRAVLWRLEVSGAHVALIASNTSHHRFAQIVHGIGIPIISIFEAVAGECARIKTTRVLILGTATIMGSAKFRGVFAAHGIEVTGPKDPDIRAQTARLSEELQHGKTADSAARLDDIARMCRKQQFSVTPMVCLACTELPLAVFESDGIKYINSSAVHIRAVFDYAASE